MVSTASISPSTGPEVGGTDILVRGDGFVPTDDLECLIDSTTRVPATYIRQGQILCSIPQMQHSIGDVTLSVSNNGQQFSVSRSTYTFYPQASVTSVSPSSGPLHGGTTVSVYGTGFVNDTLSCQFDDIAIEKRERNALAAKIQARTAELEHELEQQEMDMIREGAAASDAVKKTLRDGFEKRKKALEDGIQREKKKLETELKEKHAAKFKEIDVKEEGVEQNILRRKSETETKIIAIEKEVNDSIEDKESAWRKKALVWLNKARRKFEAKDKADAERIAAKKRRM